MLKANKKLAPVIPNEIIQMIILDPSSTYIAEHTQHYAKVGETRHIYRDISIGRIVREPRT